MTIGLGGCGSLAQLPGAAELDGSVSGGFWLSYVFMDVVVQTDKFESLSLGRDASSPSWSPISDAFRLSSTRALLAEALARSSPLVLCLCREGHVIARAAVDLGGLVSPAGDHGALAGRFALLALDAAAQDHCNDTGVVPPTPDAFQAPLAAAAPDGAPFVELRVRVTEARGAGAAAPPDEAPGDFARREARPGRAPEAEDAAEGAAAGAAPLLALPRAERLSVELPGGEEEGPAASGGEGAEGDPPEPPPPEGEPLPPRDAAAAAAAAPVPPPGVRRRWRLTAAIQSITGGDHAANLLVSFSLPLLDGTYAEALSAAAFARRSPAEAAASGTSKTLRSRPAWVPARGTAAVDRGVGSVVFESAWARLPLVAQTSPPVATIVERTAAGGEAPVAAAALPLERLLRARPQRFRCPVSGERFESMAAYGRHRAQALAEGLVPVPPPRPVMIRLLQARCRAVPTPTAAEAGGSNPAAVEAMLVLEELGPPEGPAREDPPPTPTPDPTPTPTPTPNPNPNPTPTPDPDPTPGAPAAQAAWEAWRLAQEAAWAENLRQKEAAALSRLEAQAEEREAQRAASLRRAAGEYAKLEGRLRAALEEVEAKGRALAAAEASLARERASQASDLGMLQRRVREESRAGLEAERRRSSAAERRASLAEERCEALHARLKALDEEFAAFRAAQRRTPEAGLRAQAARLEGQLSAARADLAARDADASRARLEAEKLRGHAQRLARALQREQGKQAARERRQLEQLRLEYSAREERFLLDGDRKALGEIRRELGSLRTAVTAQAAGEAARRAEEAREAAAAAKRRAEEGRAAPLELLRASAEAAAAEEEEEVEALEPVELGEPRVRRSGGGLRAEREALLASGLYDEDDPLVRELDRAIRASAAVKRSIGSPAATEDG